EHHLLLVLVLADLDAARFETGLVEAHLEPLDDAGLDVLGAAARTLLRQAVAEPAYPGQPLPFAAVPAIGAGDLAAAFEADQGRHDLDLQLMRDIEREVVHRARHGVGERRIVLREDGQAGAARQFTEHRRGQFTGRAIALDD